jgi:hypothetical protein
MYCFHPQDQGSPPQYSETTLYVNVIDADDQNPRFYDDRYTAALPDSPTQVSSEPVKCSALMGRK